jgi:hypothetical protein
MRREKDIKIESAAILSNVLLLINLNPSFFLRGDLNKRLVIQFAPVKISKRNSLFY